MQNIPVQTVKLAKDLIINQTIQGLWQVSGTHGAINPLKSLEDMHHYFEN